ncbi:hypothetical protein [Ottowia sp. VDI28]|uniref:hypothetical protein n=1 Tax=Ottowia sp. VDI28 TaxID=3133968 RepID=UPI003C2DA698
MNPGRSAAALGIARHGDLIAGLRALAFGVGERVLADLAVGEVHIDVSARRCAPKGMPAGSLQLKQQDIPGDCLDPGDDGLNHAPACTDSALSMRSMSQRA